MIELKAGQYLMEDSSQRPDDHDDDDGDKVRTRNTADDDGDDVDGNCWVGTLRCYC